MLLTPDDRDRFLSGSHVDLASVLGAHPTGDPGKPDAGVWFAVWAPNADRVDVIGSWNDWSPGADPLHPDDSGIWHGVVAGASVGDAYKYRIRNRDDGSVVDKADPIGFQFEEPPRTASVVADLSYDWGDDQWMADRATVNALDAPMSIYELHLGSWRYEPGGYRALAVQLADYLDETGFTHVELLPIMEHPFYGSWGYQTLGYFAPSRRYGTPADAKFLIDHLHQRGYGVILDWVPSHFPLDQFGLARFDGTHLYEHADPRMGFHPDWKSGIFNYDRHEVRSFLMSSALFWLGEYHADGLRVDAVASMLYRDYSREEGQWIPNEQGGRENLGAVSFLTQLNQSVYNRHPDVQMIAEESTAWGGVSRPTETGGLGFGMKWDMGWMHDTLQFLARDPIHRNHHLSEATFRSIYAFTENFVLPLSHDEVVHGKGSMAHKMPGDRWQQLANLRLLYGYQWAAPGKPLLFMGGEFAASDEWSHDEELAWGLLQYDEHKGVQRLVADLNRLQRAEPALHRVDFEPDGYRSITDDHQNTVMVFERRAPGERPVLVLVNYTPVPRPGYRVGVDDAGPWTELLNTDDESYGGSGVANAGALQPDAEVSHGRDWSLTLDLPPLATIFLAPLGA
ncbi:MAG: 1,4-alpha-glucan branching protein GlgB [Actinomycetota bacterium]